MSFLRAIENEGIYHIQFNIISSDSLRKAMKEPEKYRDLMVRVASFTVYFVDLTAEQQMDIINRTGAAGLLSLRGWFLYVRVSNSTAYYHFIHTGGSRYLLAGYRLLK